MGWVVASAAPLPPRWRLLAGPDPRSL